MIRREREDQGVIGIALSAAVGFASGLAAGMIVGEMLGDVHADRVRRALGRLRKKPVAPISPDRVIAAVQDALREHTPLHRRRRQCLQHRVIDVAPILLLAGQLP